VVPNPNPPPFKEACLRYLGASVYQTPYKNFIQNPNKNYIQIPTQNGIQITYIQAYKSRPVKHTNHVQSSIQIMPSQAYKSCPVKHTNHAQSSIQTPVYFCMQNPSFCYAITVVMNQNFFNFGVSPDRIFPDS
jgi:hypothetical protein